MNSNISEILAFQRENIFSVQNRKAIKLKSLSIYRKKCETALVCMNAYFLPQKRKKVKHFFLAKASFEIFTMYGMDKRKLRLMPHDVAWKDDFLSEKRRIEEAVGDSPIQIEHVGSTSIPAVWAKPILDIAILCGTKGLEVITDSLVKLGYQYRGRYDEKDGHFYAVLDKENVRLCQAHIYTEANDDWHLKLKFRDCLRQNTELAREYNEYKLDLAAKVSDKSEYAEIKSKWVDSFILKIK